MFNGCQIWRNRLEQMADGELSPEQFAALQKHLTECTDCSSLYVANSARRKVLLLHESLLTPREAYMFDEDVIAILRVPPPPATVDLPTRLRQFLRSLPADFLQQMAGGMLAATAITIVCLCSALHPKTEFSQNNRVTPQMIPAAPPVALESLLQSHSPRAYSLWVPPKPGNNRPLRPVANPPRPRLKNRGQQGSIGTMPLIG